MLEEIRYELNQVLSVVNDEAAWKETFGRILFQDPIETTEVAALAVPLLDLSPIHDGRLETNSTDMSGSRGALVPVVGGLIEDRQGLGWNPTPLQQLLNSGAEMEGFAGSQDPSESSPDIPAVKRNKLLGQQTPLGNPSTALTDQ